MKTDFVRVVSIDTDASESVRFVNLAHIKQIYQKNGKIVIELSGYDTIELNYPTLDAFMEHFIKS